MSPRTAYLLFIDESGTHDLRTVDPKWPIFVLLGLLVGETYYRKTLVPRVKSFKAKYGISKSTPLHSRHIRRHEDTFLFLNDPVLRESFYQDLNRLFDESRVRIFASVIDKTRLANRFLISPNPYYISLSQLLSVICGPPGTPGPWRPLVTRIIAESRGKVEDRALQREYVSFARSGLSSYGAEDVQTRHAQTVRRIFPPAMDFAGKSAVVAGLELADLAAYPIGRAFVGQNWENPAYLAVARKLRAQVVFP